MEFFNLKLVSKQQLTVESTYYTFEVPPHLNKIFNYTPGQYVSLSVEDEKRNKHTRSYSICGSLDEENVSICVKLVPNGKVSNLLFNNYNEGDQIEISAQAGEFTLSEAALNQSAICFITGGSGITPIKSILQELIAKKYTGSIYLIYGNQSEQNTIFYKELKELSESKIQSIFVMESLSANNTVDEQGILTEDNIANLLLKLNVPLTKTAFFLSGPPIIIRNAQEHLLKNNTSNDLIFSEKFFNEVPQNIDGELKRRTIQVKNKNKTQTVTINSDQSILSGVLAAGIKVDYSCRTGTCLSCICKLNDGKIHTESPLENDGKILACQSYPLSDDVNLDFDKSKIEKFFSNRDFLIFLGVFIAIFCFLFFSNSSNETYIAKGKMNTGHESLQCVECHKPADGSTRQQLQINAKNFLGFNHDEVDFGNEPVNNKQCLECHNRPNDRHPTHRFMEPRFSEARAEIHPENCTSCHQEHSGKRVTLTNQKFCMHCHQDIEIKNDPLDISHKQLIYNENWQSCIQCHDFHGNHVMNTPEKIQDTLLTEYIKEYFEGGKDPFSDSIKYKAKETSLKLEKE